MRKQILKRNELPLFYIWGITHLISLLIFRKRRVIYTNKHIKTTLALKIIPQFVKNTWLTVKGTIFSKILRKSDLENWNENQMKG